MDIHICLLIAVWSAICNRVRALTRSFARVHDMHMHNSTTFLLRFGTETKLPNGSTPIHSPYFETFILHENEAFVNFNGSAVSCIIPNGALCFIATCIQNVSSRWRYTAIPCRVQEYAVMLPSELSFKNYNLSLSFSVFLSLSFFLSLSLSLFFFQVRAGVCPAGAQCQETAETLYRNCLFANNV